MEKYKEEKKNFRVTKLKILLKKKKNSTTFKKKLKKAEILK